MDLIQKYLKKLSPVTNTLSSVVNDVIKPTATVVGGLGKSYANALTVPFVAPQINRNNQALQGSLQQIQQRLAKPGISPAERARYTSLQRSLGSQQQSNTNLGASLYKRPMQVAGEAIGTGATILGAPQLATRAGLATAGVSGVLGGVINKATGGSFGQGLASGVGSTPQILGVGSITNPLIAKYAAKLAAPITNPAGKFIAGRLATGALNVPEGAVMSSALGRNPLDPKSIAMDFAFGALGGSNPSKAAGKQALADTPAIPNLSYKRIDNLISHEGAPDRARVEFYKKQIQEGKPVAPLYLIKEGDKFGVEDGKHRLQAYKELGETLVPTVMKSDLNEDTVRAINRHLDGSSRGTTQAAMGLVGDTAATPAQVKGAKYAGSINTERLNVDEGARDQLRKQVELIKPELDAVKGRPITKGEIEQAAKESNLLQKTISREESLQGMAALTKLREAVAAGAEGQGLTREWIENLKVLDSQAHAAGQRLNSFRNDANPSLATAKERIIARLGRLGHKTEDLVREGEKVNWDDARQVTDFYRKFVKPTWGEIAEEYRYMNLLSSPKTHIVNAFSGAIQAGIVRPTTKLASGAIDAVASTLKGEARTRYISEVPVYYRGMFNAIPDALTKVRDIFTGKQGIENLDLNRIPTGNMLSKGNVVSKGLEAMDQFFGTLIKGAEGESLAHRYGKQAKDVTKMQIDAEAADMAQYTVFRQGLDSAGQGALLNWVDKGTKAILELRRVPGFGWFVPFVQTPMNIMKQGIEYSPAGLATLPGSKDKTEQLAKAMIGSTVFAGAGYLALQDKITWAAPKDQEQSRAFYAAGMQPYAVKIGDKWVSYSKIGPLAYPLAMAAAIKNGFQDDPKSAANSFDEKALSSLTGVMGFFADQSYMQGIGDLVKSVEGREGFNLSKVAGNVATQYIPLSSLQRWVTNVIDPVYRKGGSVYENIAKGIPGLSDDQPYYEDPFGDPSRRQMPELNAVSPLGITKERPDMKELYKLRGEELRQNAIANREKKDLEKALREPGKANQAEASGEGSNKQDLIAQKRAELDEQLARRRLEAQGGTKEINGKLLYVNDSGKVASVQLDRKLTPPQLTGQPELDKERIADYKGQVTAKINDITKLYELGKLTAEEADTKIADLRAKKTISTTKKVTAKGSKKVRKITAKRINLRKSRLAATVKKVKPMKVKQYRLTPRKLKKVNLKKKSLTRSR